MKVTNTAILIAIKPSTGIDSPERANSVKCIANKRKIATLASKSKIATLLTASRVFARR